MRSLQEGSIWRLSSEEVLELELIQTQMTQKPRSQCFWKKWGCACVARRMLVRWVRHDSWERGCVWGGGIAHAPRKICKKRDIFGCRALHRTTTQGTKANTPALVKAAMTQRPLTMVIWTPSLAFSLTQPYSDIQAGRLGPTPLCFYMLQGLYLCSVD